MGTACFQIWVETLKGSVVDSRNMHGIAFLVPPMLYHVKFGFPKKLRLPAARVILNYTNHARAAAVGDRYGNLTQLLPATLDPTTAQTVEVETENGVVVKVVYRIATGTDLDLVLAVGYAPGRINYVRTVWANLASDTHTTLNPTRYGKVA